MRPLADRVRPAALEDVVGQEHILGRGKVLFNVINNKHLMNMIFFGPPGTGKTTVANIIAKITDKKLFKLNATNASVKDIQEIINSLDSLMGYKGVVLYLDEIQNFNRKQQQSLLEYIEDGRITLIASTADNPYHYIYGAILSRSMVFEFKSLKKDDIVKALSRAEKILKEDIKPYELSLDEGILEYIAVMCNGDLRKALNLLETLVYSVEKSDNKIKITLDEAVENLQLKSFNFDNKGDNYYDALSALQKSIRGSDPDAALYYAGVLIKGGQLLSICRRLLVIASEDIGLAYPQAASIVYSLVQSATQLGLPEGRIPIAQAVILLATSPKSNSAIVGIDAALNDINNNVTGEIPMHLRDAHYAGAEKINRVGYKYPFNYEGNYVEQQYLPDELASKRYYVPGNNKMEGAIKSFIEKLKTNKK